MNLDINKEKNADYFEIIEKDYTDLMDRWNKLNKRMQKTSIPDLLVFTVKSELRSIGKDLKILQKDYIKWNKKAGSFLAKPHYIFEKDQDNGVVFLHYSNMLRHVIRSMDSHMVMIANNYNMRWDGYKGQRNFIIAIISFVLTFLGLVVALYTIFAA